MTLLPSKLQLTCSGFKGQKYSFYPKTDEKGTDTFNKNSIERQAVTVKEKVKCLCFLSTYF